MRCSTVASLAAGLLAAFHQPGEKLRAAILHLAAGVVFAVVAVELIPDLLRDHSPGWTTFGFALGVVSMLGVRGIVEHEEKTPAAATAALPAGLLAGVAVDLAIDGLLLGVGFAAGAKEGAFSPSRLPSSWWLWPSRSPLRFAVAGLPHGVLFAYSRPF